MFVSHACSSYSAKSTVGRGIFFLAGIVIALSALPEAAAAADQVAGSAVRAAGWQTEIAASRALYSISMLLATGIALFLLGVPAAAGIGNSLQRVLRICAGCAVVAGIAYLQIRGIAATGTSHLLDVAAFWRAADSALGSSVALATAGLLLLLIRPFGKPALALGVALLLLSRVLTGHSVTLGPVWLLVPLMLLHVAGAAFWYGSLGPLFVALRRLPPADAAAVVREFSELALLAVGSLAFAGAVMALVHLSAPSALLATWYGQLLIMKLTWFTVLLGFAAWHKLRLSRHIEAGDHKATRRLRYSIVAEAVVMSLVVLISSNLASTDPSMSAETREETIAAKARGTAP